jgi:peptidyl-prolyl cis-trans isomerase SurA
MKYILICLLLGVSLPLYAQTGFEDKVVAVVGDEIILESELNASFDFYSAQITVPESQQPELRMEILDQMINDKLLLIEARKDTSISVTDEEVEAAVDNYVDELRERMGNTEFEAELSQEGLTLEQLKDRFRKRIRDQLYVQALVDTRLRSKINVTADEVETFYNARKDSIPESPTLIRLSHILETVKTSEKNWNETMERAQNIYKVMQEGQSFETLALRFSDDRLTAEMGGDLGYVTRNDLPDEIADVVFTMEPGDISAPLKGDFGYHIFKCDAKEEKATRLKHILVSVRPTAEDSVKTREHVQGLFEQIRGGASFSALATEFSDDPNSRPFGGDLGWMPINELPTALSTAIDSMKVGELNGPVLSEFGYHILRLDDRNDSSIPNLEEIRDELTQLLYAEKLQKELDELLSRLRGETYVEVK